MKNIKSLVVFCGGTGGHFYPGLSVARAFKKGGGSAKLFLIGKHSRKQSAIAADLGVESIILSVLPAPVGIIGKLKFLLFILIRTMEARQQLILEKPDWVLGMGSFTSVPAAIAAKMLSIPIFLHDGNSFIGKANITLSRFAKKIALAFPPQNSEKLKCPFTITGMPLRQELTPENINAKYGESLIDAVNRVFDINFRSSHPLILVFGGSQGAATFNSAIPAAFGIIDRDDLQIIHISGAGNKKNVENSYKDVPSNSLIIDGTEEMGLLYAAADLVVCRAGGSTIAELALFGKSSILVPFPYATDDHQRFNAEYYTSAGNSLILHDDECIPAEFAEIILDCLERKEEYAEKTKIAQALAHPDAAEEVIGMMET
jgi:UDP-N-acetylglucosamine--N-acetylmuramyl-(pentapeptide) pyrophosphoryl-undecaprenol N-acetylglucosamine transferase